MPILGTIASSTQQGLSTGSYEYIAKGNGTGSSQSITFSSVPSTYKHLQIRGYGIANYSGPQDGAFGIRVNGDTGNYYSRQGWSVVSGSFSVYNNLNSSPFAETGEVVLNTTAIDYMGPCVITILDYTDTTWYRTFRGTGGMRYNNTAGTGVITGTGGFYSANKNAITSLTVYQQNGNWLSDTSWYLYGIKG